MSPLASYKVLKELQLMITINTRNKHVANKRGGECPQSLVMTIADCTDKQLYCRTVAS